MSLPEAKTRGRLQMFWLTLYYFAIILGVIYLHGRGGLDTPSFIYQGF